LNYRGLNIPKVSFGNIDSDALFADKEQELFDFYEVSRNRYRKALDIGANIGVHSILMSKQGWEVDGFEPDPQTASICWKNIESHGARVRLMQKAVSDCAGTSTFVRVNGNTTGSHLEGCKSPYGPTERFEVETVDCRPLFDWADFAKIDCEGHEATLLKTLTPDQLKHLEIMLEVGSPKNAVEIYQHLAPMGIGMWTQQRKWSLIRGLHDMPIHHSEGALFIGRRPPFGNVV
jgi:FkbM family methyltransferase